MLHEFLAPLHRPTTAMSAALPSLTENRLIGQASSSNYEKTRTFVRVLKRKRQTLDKVVWIAPGRNFRVLVESGIEAPAAATGDNDVDLRTAKVALVADDEADVGGRVAGTEESDALREEVVGDGLRTFRNDGLSGADGDEGTRRISLFLELEIERVGAGVLNDEINVAEAIVRAVRIACEQGCVRAEWDGADLIHGFGTIG